LNGDPESKIFYVLEIYEGVQEYCNWINEIIEDAIKSDLTTSYVPELEEMVLAKFEGVFYRAMLTGKSGDKFLVFFVDYGNISEVAATDMKPLSPKLNMEIIIHEVYIANLPNPLNNKAKEILGKEDGFEIESTNERSAEGDSYVVNIVGL
jgi:hypothetical protein